MTTRIDCRSCGIPLSRESSKLGPWTCEECRETTDRRTLRQEMAEATKRSNEAAVTACRLILAATDVEGDDFRLAQLRASEAMREAERAEQLSLRMMRVLS